MKRYDCPACAGDSTQHSRYCPALLYRVHCIGKAWYVSNVDGVLIREFSREDDAIAFCVKMNAANPPSVRSIEY